MKLLRILPTLDPVAGGPAAAARMIDEEWVRQGNSVTVLTLDAPGADYLQDYPCKVVALGPSRGGYRYNRLLTPWLRQHAPEFDAVIVDGIWQYHAFGAWRALAGGPTPYFVFTHGMLDPWFKKTYPAKHLKKWAYWPWADYRVLRDAAAVLFTCEEERLLASQSFWLYRCTEEVVAFGTRDNPAGAAGEQLAQRFVGKYPELKEKSLLLFLSRIHEKKGCDLLIQAFARSARSRPDLHLIMAGPDQTGWKTNLRELAQAQGVADRITWTGMLQGEDKWGAMHAAEAFCLPSHQENFGIVVAEALSCGTPVLISDKVNIWREVAHDHAGIVKSDTVDGCHDSLESWLSMSMHEKQVMRMSARRSFENRFRIERVAEGLLETMLRHPAVEPSLFSHPLDNAHEPS